MRALHRSVAVYHSENQERSPNGRERPALFLRFWDEARSNDSSILPIEISDIRPPHLVYGRPEMEGQDPPSSRGSCHADDVGTSDEVGNLSEDVRVHPKKRDRLPRRYFLLPRFPGRPGSVVVGRKRRRPKRLVRPPIVCAYCGGPLGAEYGAVYRESGRLAVGWHMQAESRAKNRKMCWEMDEAHSLEWDELVEVMTERGGPRVGVPHWNR